MIRYKEFRTPRRIQVGNREHLLAFVKGDIKFTSGGFEGEIKEVLWVPDLTENLLSDGRTMQLLEEVEASFDAAAKDLQEDANPRVPTPVF